MAIGISTCVIRADGATTNGGGWVEGSSGVNYSNQASAQWALTGLTSSGSGDTILSAAAHADMVGNWACCVSGTNVTQCFVSVVSVVAGVSITFSTSKAGGSVATGVVANGVINIGGAFKLGATSTGRTDDDFFEAAPNTGGNKYYIKGSHTTASNVSISATGVSALKNIIVGYNSTFTDTPTPQSGNQPTINYGANIFLFATHWEIFNITFTGTSAAGVTIGAFARVDNCKLSNTSGTANRAALTHGNNLLSITGCEFTSTNGYCVVGPNANGGSFIGNYFHDSVSAIRPSGATGGMWTISDNIFDTISTAAIDFAAGSVSGGLVIRNNTFWNSSPSGSSKAVDIGGSSLAIITVIANHFSGWVTALNSAALLGTFSTKNNFYNNTTDRTNWTAGLDDTAYDPSFTDAPNGNFNPGTNLHRVGFPTTFAGGLSTSYSDVGAVHSKYLEWFTDFTMANVLTDQGNAKYDSLSNNRTPTYVKTSDATTKTGTAYGPASGNTGSYDGSDRWTDPGEANVKSGTAYKANSTTNNKTGTLVVGGSSQLDVKKMSDSSSGHVIKASAS